jgi:hypothetical protein
MEIIFMILTIGFWIIIGLLPVLSIIFMVYAYYDNRKEEKLNEYKRLYWFVSDEYYKFCSDNNYLNESKALRKFFSDKTLYEKALSLKQNREFESENYTQYAITRFEKEEIKKKRQYSYQYEKLIYEIFSPFAVYISDDKWILNRGISSTEIIDKIGEYLCIDLVESVRLFEEFIENGLIQKTRFDDIYVLGYILYHWDCVYENDWSFSKWMTFKRNHIYRKVSLDSFIEKFGSYDVVNQDYKWYVRFGESRNYIIDILIDNQKIIDIIYSWDRTKGKRVYDYEFGRDNSEETKNKIVMFIEENSRYLYVESGLKFSLNYDYQRFKNDNSKQK